MQAEIIAVGTELVNGAKLDTNSQWLSNELAALGIETRFHSSVGDDSDEMVALFTLAGQRSDVVLITGGLGPTLDDITRQVLADVAGVDLVTDDTALAHLEELFAQRNRRMPERNRIQAQFPEGSRVLPNPRGTAPGIWFPISLDGGSPTVFAAFPGVPSEMKVMFRQEVLPKLTGGGTVIRRARINCFGAGESTMEEQLGDLTARGRDPEVGITASAATITLRITATGETAEQCEAKITTAKHSIRERLGSLVFGEEDEELQDAIIALLRKTGSTLSTAESGTGGLLADRLTEVDHFEDAYLGGVIVPTERAKQRLLGMCEGFLSEHESISAEVTEAMATACRDRFGSDFALAITERPDYEADDATADPNTFLALATPTGTEVVRQQLLGDPAIQKIRTAKAAMNLLRLHLLKNS